MTTEGKEPVWRWDSVMGLFCPQAFGEEHDDLTPEQMASHAADLSRRLAASEAGRQAAVDALEAISENGHDALRPEDYHDDPAECPVCIARRVLTPTSPAADEASEPETKTEDRA